MAFCYTSRGAMAGKRNSSMGGLTEPVVRFILFQLKKK